MRLTPLFLSTLWRALLLSSFLLAQACSNLDDVTKDWPLEKLQQEAKESIDNGAYDKAIDYYEKLEVRALGTPLAQQAQIEKAYAQYKAGMQAEASVTLDRFMRLHPASPLIDYALYLRGLVNFNGDTGFLSNWTGQQLDDRDQKASKESYASFKELATRFPNSKYTADAKARMAYIMNTLAAYELSVARFYVRHNAHLAAANRAQMSLAEYPNAPTAEQALTLLINAYGALGSNQLRDDAKRVMGVNFPKNPLGIPPAAAPSTTSAPTNSTPASQPAQKP